MDFEVTRGDTFRFKFQLKDKLGQILNLNKGIEIYFTIKKNRNSKKCVPFKVLLKGGEMEGSGIKD